MEPLGDVGDEPPREPRDAPGFVNRALERQGRGDLVGAVADCGKALQIDPQFVEAYRTRAMIRREQGYIDRALADVERALQFKPREVADYLVLGEVHLAQDKLDLARQDYDRALEIDPRNVQAYTSRAQIRAAQTDICGAIADCDRGLKIDPHNVDLLLTRAAALWEEGEFPRARADCDEAIRLAPANGRARFLRGNIHQDLEGEEGAAADFDEAIRLDPSLKEMLRAQGYEPESSGRQLPVPAEARGLPASLGGLRAETPGTRGGGRSWVIVPTVHGALAGAFYGMIHGKPLATILALLFFPPIFLALFLGPKVGGRRAALGGLVLGIGAIIGLAIRHDFSEPLVNVTGDGHYVRMGFWVLAWGVFGACYMIFAGATQFQPILAHMQRGVSRVVGAARTGKLLGLALGALVGVFYWVFPGVLAGLLAGCVAGIILGGAAGNDRWFVPLVLLGAALGAVAGATKPQGVYEVIGAGISTGLYWAVAGGFVGALAGGSVAARSVPRVVSGPLFSQLLGRNPLTAMLGQGALAQVGGMNVGVALLAALCGLFLGASIGIVTGSVLGGLAYVPKAFDVVADDPLPWIGTGAMIGLVFSGFFSSRIVSHDGPQTRGSSVSLASSLRGLPLVLVGLTGAAIGAGIAALAWVGHLEPGGFLYWVLTGAGTGAILGSRLWALMEKGDLAPAASR